MLACGCARSPGKCVDIWYRYGLLPNNRLPHEEAATALHPNDRWYTHFRHFITNVRAPPTVIPRNAQQGILDRIIRKRKSKVYSYIPPHEWSDCTPWCSRSPAGGWPWRPPMCLRFPISAADRTCAVCSFAPWNRASGDRTLSDFRRCRSYCASAYNK